MDDYSSFKNRLTKNAKHIEKIMNKLSLEAYRIYDKDIPQFPFAIDRYGHHLHIQEYDTGWKRLPADYQFWLDNVIMITSEVLNINQNNIHVKKRMRQRGLYQYEKQSQDGEDFIVEEFGRKFWVNLDNYLDTGLFLDHRPTRYEVGNLAKGKRVLNLFAYTGSFSVYAATGGAIYSETVDLSNTYCNWAQRNFILNNISEKHHLIIREDVFVYLKNAIKDHNKFDLIIMDPPCFSNSKKMIDILDIQRDHVILIKQAMQLLDTKGCLYFSNNLRTFKIDESLKTQYHIQDISYRSVPEDFRNRNIHHCWKITHFSTDSLS